MGKVSLDLDGLKALREHARQRGTLEQWSELALEYIDAIVVIGAAHIADGEQYRKNWLALQDATGEHCLDLAIAKVGGLELTEEQKALCQFYMVNTKDELITEQATHIRRLLDKLLSNSTEQQHG